MAAAREIAERELRESLAELGHEPAERIVAEIRSGAWERRQRRNMTNLLRNRARLWQLRRDGYSFDAQHRLVAPTSIVRPISREAARPRERRARRSTGSSRGSPAREPAEPEPPPLDAPRGAA